MSAFVYWSDEDISYKYKQKVVNSSFSQ